MRHQDNPSPRQARLRSTRQTWGLQRVAISDVDFDFVQVPVMMLFFTTNSLKDLQSSLSRGNASHIQEALSLPRQAISYCY